MRVVGVLLFVTVAVVAVAGSVVQTDTDIPVMIPRASDPPALVTAFTARGGKAAQIESSTLVIDGRAAARITRIEGSISGKNSEFTITLGSVPKSVRSWLRSFVSGKYKKRDISIITKTPGTGAGESKPLEFTKYGLSGVLIRELSFPALGVAEGVIKVRVLAQNSEETKNVKPAAVSDAGAIIRSQFFKLALTPTKKDTKNKKKKSVAAAMGKSVYKMDAFSISRGMGFGSMDTTTIGAYFPASSDKKAISHSWAKWYTKRETTFAGNGGTTTAPREGKLTLYYWTGSSMDRSAGEAAHGALKVLFELELKDVRLSKLDSGDGKGTLTVGSIKMSKH